MFQISSKLCLSLLFALLATPMLCGTALAEVDAPPNPNVSLSPLAPPSAVDAPRLRELAAALARALDEPEFRHQVGALLAGKEPVYLAELPGEPGLHAKLAHLPPVEVHVPTGLESWKASLGAPRVTYVSPTLGDDQPPVVELFDAAGGSVLVDPRGELGPVLVLEYRDAEAVSARAGFAADQALAGIDTKACADNELHVSNPLILVAQIRDIHEGAGNGPEGFAYFSIAGTEKTGDLPTSLGGLSGWSTNVWASNFQGPELVKKSRDQWEWTTNGWLEIAWNWYPATFLRHSTYVPSTLGVRSYTVMEDDEWWNPDDYVGRVKIDHSLCNLDVFDQGLSSGWTRERVTYGDDDVVWVRYKLYCTKSDDGCTATVPCPGGGILTCDSSGACGSGDCRSGFDWVECNGNRSYCDDGPDLPDLPF